MIFHEPSSVVCRHLWKASDEAVTSRLTYVETSSALAQARRQQRITVSQHHASIDALNALWGQCDIVDLDQSLAEVASLMAHDHALRGYDAVHCASAAHVQDSELVAVSGDRKLLTAWSWLGIQTIDVNAMQ